MNALLFLFLGIVAAGLGGELFLRGTVGIAALARVPAAIIAVTVAAFATSSPELSVAIGSARAGTPEISLGDVLGSNIVNIALILGLALLIRPMQVDRAAIRRDYPVALAIPGVTVLLCLDGVINAVDATVLAFGFFCWFSIVLRDALRARAGAGDVLGEHRWLQAGISAAAGLFLLVVAGQLIAGSAHDLARLLGISDFVIGGTLVALGTSVPELATVLIARLRGRDDIGLGTLLGSNIYNGLAIVATAAGLHDIRISWQSTLVTLVCGALAVAIARPGPQGMLSRRRGVFLLALWGASAVFLLAG